MESGVQWQVVRRAGDDVRLASGLVTIESGMIALIDLPQLLSVSIGEGADIAADIAAASA